MNEVDISRLILVFAVSFSAVLGWKLGRRRRDR